MHRFLQLAQDNFDFTRKMRRDFHMHPETGFEEVRTSGIVAKELASYGLEVKTGIAKTGVIGLLKGEHNGPVILLRADMDALPVLEENKVEYASQTPGKMHACGHDSHTAMMLTVAKILAPMKSELHGTIKFVFQPAEEGQGGAALMVKEGVLENPVPDYSMGMHVWSNSPAGTIVLKNGPMMAGSKMIEIMITGKGGHGAMPHQTIDPVITAAQMVMAMQAIISRNVNAEEAAVLSITSLQAGDTFNVIPGKAVLKGTLRFFEKDIETLVMKRLAEVVDHTAKAMECTAELNVDDVTPSVYNDSELIEQLKEVSAEVLPDVEVDTETLTMGSEDFAYMMDEIPGAYVFIGTGGEGKDFPHHHPRFDIDESALPNGVALLSAMTYKLLQA